MDKEDQQTSALYYALADILPTDQSDGALESQHPAEDQSSSPRAAQHIARSKINHVPNALESSTLDRDYRFTAGKGIFLPHQVTDDGSNIRRLAPPSSRSRFRTDWYTSLSRIENMPAEDIERIVEIEEGLYSVQLRESSEEMVVHIDPRSGLQFDFKRRFLDKMIGLAETQNTADNALWKAIGDRWQLDIAEVCDVGDGIYVLQWRDVTQEATVVHLQDCSDAAKEQFSIRFVLPEASGGPSRKEETSLNTQTSRSPPGVVIAQDVDSISIEGGYDSNRQEYDDADSDDASRISNPIALVRRQIGSVEEGPLGDMIYKSIDGDVIKSPSVEDVDAFWQTTEPFSNNHIEPSSSEEDWAEVRSMRT